MHRFSPNPNLAHLIDWYEWEDDAWQKARAQDKPMMLFLSAFWCRYCQRMDEGAFSDRENMALLNAYFVALRAENAKRPDIDARYNLNGWPTIAFFTPSGELLAAANYLPAEEFKEVLLNVYLSYRQKKSADAGQKLVDENPQAAGQNERAAVSTLAEITKAVMGLADKVHGGYGRGQKFIQADANEFLLSRYQATHDSLYLDQVCLTLDRMRQGPIYDGAEGGFFRTTTGADWSQPHREKLLAEQAGLLANCLRLFSITRRAQYAGMADEIIGYLDRKLFDPARGAYFGCEDFLRRERAADPGSGEFFTIIDECIYVDANAQLAVAYLEAAALLNRADCEARALTVIEFLWTHCRSRETGMGHFYDGAPHLSGLLNDQACMGFALVQAYLANGDGKFLERARELAEFVVERLKNPRGGYFDLCAGNVSLVKLPLTDIAQNGATARFFLRLAQAVNDAKYRQNADWALRALGAHSPSFGIDAAKFGQALGEWLSRA